MVLSISNLKKTKIKMNTRPLFDAVIELVENYNHMAKKAIKSGEGILYIPGTLDKHTFIYLCSNPDQLSTGNSNEKETCYLSLKEGNRGRNTDGTLHDGFLVLEPIERKILKVIDPDGREIFSISEDDQNTGSDTETIEATWCAYEIRVTTRDGKKFLLKTHMGIRGMAPVTVIRTDQDWIVLDRGHRLDLVSVTKE